MSVGVDGSFIIVWRCSGNFNEITGGGEGLCENSGQKDAEDLLETKLVETDGGLTIDVGDAAAGGAISSLPMIGLGLLRRRFLLI